MNSPRDRHTVVEKIRSHLDKVGRDNPGSTLFTALAQLVVVAAPVNLLPNLTASPVCWLGVATGLVAAGLAWALITRRLEAQGAFIGFGAWLAVQFAAGFVVPVDPGTVDAAIALGVFMGLLVAFAVFQVWSTMQHHRPR